MIAISFLRVCMMGTIVGVGLTGCSQPSNSNNKAANNSPKSDSTATVTTNSATTIATKAPKKIAKQNIPRCGTRYRYGLRWKREP